MNKHQLLFILAINFIISCNSSKMLPEEKYLLPGKEDSKWWVINAAAKDKNDKAVHICTLLSMTTVNGKNFVSAYTAVWRQDDSSYYYVTQNAAPAKFIFSDDFPIHISTPGKDTAALEWTYYFKRDKLTQEGILENNKGISNYFSNSYSFKKQEPFVLTQMNTISGIWSSNAIKTTLLIDNGKKIKADGDLSITVFSKQQFLLDKAMAGNVHWVDIFLHSGKKISLLFRTNNKGDIMADDAIVYDEKGNINQFPALNIVMKPGSLFKSNSSAKIYPLSFLMNLPGYDIAYLIQPKMDQQEISMNKNSFWMGAITITDSTGNIETGTGNMYIFKQ